MKGWIKLYRRIQEEPDYFSEPFTRMQAWIDLNLLANHENNYIRKRGILVAIGRGQVAVSRDSLAKRWGWSPGKAKRYLDELESSGKIVQQKSNVINCITLVNYDEEQKRGTADDTANSTADDTADSNPNGFQTDANKNNKKSKEDNNLPHTHKDCVEDFNAPARDARARELLDWIASEHPAAFAMKQPFTEQHAIWLTQKYDLNDIKRIMNDMRNKHKFETNESAYDTFIAFAARDFIIKERKEQLKSGVYLNYPDYCDLIAKGKYRADDFESQRINGRVYWIKRTDLMR